MRPRNHATPATHGAPQGNKPTASQAPNQTKHEQTANRQQKASTSKS